MEVTVLLVIFVFIVAISVSQNRSRERREKLRIIEEAIRSGHLDSATKQELVGELTGRRPAPLRAEVRHGGWARVAFAVGWLGLFLGIGLIAVGDRDTVPAGITVAAISFALISLPMAMRELDRDRSRAIERR